MCVIGWCRLNTLSPAFFLCINLCNYLIFNFKQLPLWSSSSISLYRTKMDSRIIFTSHKEDFLMGEIIQQILTRNYFVQFVAKSLASLLTGHVQFKKGIDCQKKLFLILWLQHFLELEFTSNIGTGQFLTCFWAI